MIHQHTQGDSAGLDVRYVLAGALQLPWAMAAAIGLTQMDQGQVQQIFEAAGGGDRHQQALLVACPVQVFQAPARFAQQIADRHTHIVEGQLGSARLQAFLCAMGAQHARLIGIDQDQADP
ncbi:hypothetical protein D3C84_1087290 [compost metagenome]